MNTQVTTQTTQVTAHIFDREYLESLDFETPFFLFSREKILETFQEFKECFPKAEIHYAMKANSEPEVLQTLADAGCGFEVASRYELEMLKSINVSPERIIYGTAVKPASHIKAACEYGVNIFSVDSLSELEKIALFAPNSRIFVRLSVDETSSVFKFSEKFGTDRHNLILLLKRAKEIGVQPYGISFHIGSQTSNPAAWAKALTVVSDGIEELLRFDITIEALNIGGGFPCAYASTENCPGLQEIADNVYEQYRKLPYHLQLVLEPGRGLIAQSGIAVTSVIGRVERGDVTWLFLDAGVYNGFFETMAYQGSTRYRITSLRQSCSSGQRLYAIAGPTGDSPDVITREALLPDDLQIGDKLIIHDVGAYSLVCACSFNGFPKPDVYLV